jgi:hypothetical protein
LSVEDAVHIGGLRCSPIIGFDGGNSRRAAELRTLFLQEMCAHGVLIPYVAPSLAHGLSEVEETAEAGRAAGDRSTERAARKSAGGDKAHVRITGQPRAQPATAWSPTR